MVKTLPSGRRRVSYSRCRYTGLQISGWRKGSHGGETRGDAEQNNHPDQRTHEAQQEMPDDLMATSLETFPEVAKGHDGRDEDGDGHRKGKHQSAYIPEIDPMVMKSGPLPTRSSRYFHKPLHHEYKIGDEERYDERPDEYFQNKFVEFFDHHRWKYSEQ